MSAVTYDDLATLGAHVLNASAASVAMGHVSPQMSLVYMARPESPMGALYHDILTAAMPYPKPDVLAARERVDAFLWESGWMHRVAENVAAASP